MNQINMKCFLLHFMLNLYIFVQVSLLKMILMAWKEEVEKKPPEMSTEDAYTTLGLPTGKGGCVK